MSIKVNLRCIVNMLLCITACGSFAQTIPPINKNSSQFSALPECIGAIQLKADDAGALFVSCIGQVTYPSLINAPIEFNFYVIKLDRTGRRDASWGDEGVFKIRSDAVITCFRNENCNPSYSASARDGGFWLALSNGRILKMKPNGALDQVYLRRYDHGTKSGELFDSQGAQLWGVALQPDGGLISLSAANVPAGATNSTEVLTVRRLLADGRSEREATYRLSAPQTKVVTWSMATENLVVVLQEDGLEETARPLRTWSLSQDGQQRAIAGRAMPAFDPPGYIDPSFYVLGDGKLMYANSKGIYRWRADGTADTDFVGTGFRGGPGRNHFPLCDGPPFQSFSYPTHLSIRSNADLLHFYSIGFQIRGLFCVGPFGSIVTDNGFADSYANPISIDNAYFVVARDGGIVNVVPSNTGASLRRADSPGPAGTRARADVNVVEYYNETTDHYFITAHEHEVEFVDKGNAGPGWKRTGHLFGAWNIDTPMPGTGTVCRYYGDAAGGPNSHFYSAEKFECDALQALDLATPKGKPAWRFERDAFRITVPANGECTATFTPIYRLYNRGSERGIESNHRYVSSAEERAAMRAKGWADEGVHMCATHN